MCGCKDNKLCGDCACTHGVVPKMLSEEDQETLKDLKGCLPTILRIIKDLADEKYERLEELTETSRLIIQELGL